MGFPDKDELKIIREKLDKAEGTHLLPENPTPLEELRWDLCQKFIKYKVDNDLTQKEVGIRIGVDEAKISKILHHRIEEFSTDRLINLFHKLDSNLTLKVG